MPNNKAKMEVILERINAFTAMSLWLEDRYEELRKEIDGLKESKQ